MGGYKENRSIRMNNNIKREKSKIKRKEMRKIYETPENIF